MRESKSFFPSLHLLFRKESARVHPSSEASSHDNVSTDQWQADADKFEAEIFRNIPQEISNGESKRNPSLEGSEPRGREDNRNRDFPHYNSFGGDAIDGIVAELGDLILSERVTVGADNVTPHSGMETNQVNCDPQNIFDQEVLMIDDLRRDIEDPIDLFDELWPGIRDSLSLARKRCISELDVNNFEVSSSSDIEAGVLFCEELDEYLLDEVLLSGRRDSVDIALRRRNEK